MSNAVLEAPAPAEATTVATRRPSQVWAWMSSTDHKRIGIATLVTAFVLFLLFGVLALIMRTQLAFPAQHIVSAARYDELFTLHGSGMIYLAVTPFAIAIGVYLVPLQVGAPSIAAPRITLLGFWLYILGSLSLLLSALPDAGPTDGWYSYTPLSNATFTPGLAMPLWLLGSFFAVTGMMLMGTTVLWTALRMRAPGMTLLRMPVFTWSMVVTCLMVIAAFPSVLAAESLIMMGRVDPHLFANNVWNIAYQNLFWFYGHPVVYVMFFPFVGAVAEVLQTFTGRRFVGYKPTVFSLLAFAALSMAVWGHHMFTTGQQVNDYYSVTSNMLAIPAGIEYFGFLGTIIGGSLVFPTAMLFALAFIPQFLVGGLTGIMLGSPTLDYQFHGSYFVVGHFHYTLMAGSVFGFFAGVYYWFPKVTGVMLDERRGKIHFLLMTIGVNLAFFPMLIQGYLGMPRRDSTYAGTSGFGTYNLIETIGAFIIALSLLVFLDNMLRSFLRRRLAGPDPWGAHTLEWVTASPPTTFNFDALHRIPPIKSYAPLLDLELASRSEDGAKRDGAQGDGARLASAQPAGAAGHREADP